MDVAQHNLTLDTLNVLDFLIRRLPFDIASNVMLGVGITVNAISPKLAGGDWMVMNNALARLFLGICDGHL
ncbi:hypothetical protein [Bordetella petrii]|uniref:hypothetical protein n=1 Tax=Bordetella petrii TaxID=94624 RepID=UPI001A974C84|nr:hypothetical protein [Bordetella petrii]MBO1111845.1 hypothetical protein [Bordetella petrii]